MSKDKKEYGYEGEMAMTQLKAIMQHAEQLHDMLEPDTDLPEWVQSKITLAYDYIQTAADYMATELDEALVGNQHKIDANKNGKIDAHDFRLIRAKDGKPPFSEPYSRTKVHKDEYGNVIKNVAKRLAKKGMAANEEAIAEDGASAVLRATVARSKLRDMEGKNKSPKLISKLKARIKAAEPYYDKPVNEEAEDDGWYAHKEMHGKVSKEDWKKGWRYNKLRRRVPFFHEPTRTYHAKIKEEVESIDELSKGLLNRYQDKNEVDRERLASGLWYPKGEAGATEKQKKDSAKLGKRNSSFYLASKKTYPDIWAKNNPPHLRAGDKPARVHATEETPTNAAGSGAIAGIGVGPKGEPGVKRSAMDKYKKKNAEGAPKAGRKTFNMFMKDE